LELDWNKALKKIGKSFLHSKIGKDTPKKEKKEHKEHEDIEDKATDFDLLEDIERLTATDPGEYFKSNPTLLSKVNFVTVTDFDYVKTLGAGAYGQVYLVKKKATGDFFAMKVIGSDKELSRKYIKNLLNEREVFSVIKSEFCVNAVATFTYESLVCFVMEYLPGRDLYEEVFERENLWFDSTSLRYYLAEMVLGIEALHQNGIIHRDIKPANVLIDEDGHLKLTDFGLSEFRSKIGSTTKDGKTLIKGSAQYLAPEIVQGKDVGFEVDWWAMGVMAYLFINMEFPFDGETIQEVMDKIIKGEIDWSNVGDDEEEGEMSPVLADLIKKLLDPNPLTRLGHNGS
jgi:serine/threonine protein kinase